MSGAFGYMEKSEGDLNMYQVTKRDGTAAKFEIGKISAAITKAFKAMDN